MNEIIGTTVVGTQRLVARPALSIALQALVLSLAGLAFGWQAIAALLLLTALAFMTALLAVHVDSTAVQAAVAVAVLALAGLALMHTGLFLAVLGATVCLHLAWGGVTYLMGRINVAV